MSEDVFNTESGVHQLIDQERKVDNVSIYLDADKVDFAPGDFVFVLDKDISLSRLMDQGEVNGIKFGALIETLLKSRTNAILHANIGDHDGFLICNAKFYIEKGWHIKAKFI